MKRRIFLIVLGAVGLALVLYFTPAAPPPKKAISPSQRAKQQEILRRFEPAQSATVVVAPPAPALPDVVRVPAPKPVLPTTLVVPIQDQATIDFSIGAPVVRSGGADTEALERALKQMDEATKDIQFVPKKK
ncbi:MAG TPA: hypothetical protein VM029_15945 [Opitutaceae bacterium]|nr:hypothetical protein [Opitutaceae bacterium]